MLNKRASKAEFTSYKSAKWELFITASSESELLYYDSAKWELFITASQEDAKFACC